MACSLRAHSARVKGDVVLLKRVSAPGPSEYENLAREARRQAPAPGMKPSDMKKAIARARGRD